MFKQEEGVRGEKKASIYLQKKGYEILEKNFSTPIGELDIIAKEGGTVVFVEVKKRSSKKFGTGAEAVNEQKQRKVIKSAQIYMKRFYGMEVSCRFDVISIDAGEIKHIQNAFSA